MGKLLYIQASPRIQRSHSIAVADAFVGSYGQEHADDEIVTLNLFEASLPNFDGLAVQAKYTILHGQAHSQEELQVWKNVEQVIEQFTSADKYVLAVPMWNFGIPYRLKQYIDILIQPGHTFSYSPDKGYEGLVVGKPLLAVYARGGEYPAGSEAEAFDLQTRYVELAFGFMGFKDIRSVIVEPTLQGGPELAKRRVAEAIDRAREMAINF
ncbi:MAG: FMN-dependent NADH-azoreductase [Phycisphaerae bacterium SG8_4]|nr:MAG: FMN-dependent NADH-azoreductase [Phycisphaerae bacterium SG8_4]